MQETCMQKRISYKNLLEHVLRILVSRRNKNETFVLFQFLADTNENLKFVASSLTHYRASSCAKHANRKTYQPNEIHLNNSKRN